jgi:hypothetical protein
MTNRRHRRERSLVVSTVGRVRLARELARAPLPGHPSDWCPLKPCQGRGQARLRVYMCQAVLPFAVVLRSQTGLTVNLQGFRIRAPGGWPCCNAARQRCPCGAAFVRAVTSGPTRAGRRRGPVGPKSGRPGDRERARLARRPGRLRTVDAPRLGQCSRCAALLNPRRSVRGALCAP